MSRTVCKTTSLRPVLDPGLSGYFGSNEIGQIAINSTDTILESNAGLMEFNGLIEWLNGGGADWLWMGGGYRDASRVQFVAFTYNSLL